MFIAMYHAVMISQCPLCSHSMMTEILRCPDHLVTGEYFTIVECQHCTFRCTSDEPGIDNIGKYYASEAYTSLSGKRPMLRAWVRKQRQKIAALFVMKHVKLRRGSILDIGCATGDFLDVMKKYEWDISGIEPDAESRVRLAARNIPSLPPSAIGTVPDASKDVITLWHVLEHIHGLAEFGRHVKRILKPNGIIVIAVPNAEALDAGLYGEHWHAYELPRHLYHFTRATLKQFAEQSGLRITKLGSMPLDSVYCCLQSEAYIKGSSFRGMLRAILTLATSLIYPKRSTTILAVLRHS